jgi:hemerythrin-like domain-containing protein
MSQAPNLLNDDGTASIATALMSSHHAFRRDLARFAHALAKIENGDSSRVEAVRQEWKNLHGALHGHHEAEDRGFFPNIAQAHASARATIEGLSADHRRIDPLLERGDAAFEALPQTAAAVAVVRELEELLTPHLATEERELVPFLRDMKAFPPPPNDEAAAMYADGFAWSTHGLASDVIEKINVMLPASLLERLPAARAAFAARCARTWGTAKAGAARTPIPDAIDD